jgi:ABC-type Mn2+/Zn2+ transport system permease subunit
MAIAMGAAVASVIVGLIAAYYLRIAAGGSVVLTALLIFGAATLARSLVDSGQRPAPP